MPCLPLDASDSDIGQPGLVKQVPKLQCLCIETVSHIDRRHTGPVFDLPRPTTDRMLHQGVVLKSNGRIPITFVATALCQPPLGQPQTIGLILLHIAMKLWEVLPGRRGTRHRQFDPPTVFSVADPVR